MTDWDGINAKLDRAEAIGKRASRGLRLAVALLMFAAAGLVISGILIAILLSSQHHC